MGGWGVVLVALQCSLGLSQEAAPGPPADQAPLRARPLAAPPSGVDEFAPGPVEDATGMVAAPEGVATYTPPPSAGTAPQFAPAVPGSGSMVSDEQYRAREIESYTPERLAVYPDDPESAWWEVNPRIAFEKARREQRPMMLLFTSITNPLAMALSEEVFSSKSFNDYVKENLVICFLTYAQNPSEDPDVLTDIKNRFKVKGYPNVLIFNPNGEVEKGIRGYRKGRPVDYFNELKAVCQPVMQSIEMQKAQLMRRGYRHWKNYQEKEIFAKFVKHDLVHVVIEDAGGTHWTIKLNDLYPDDQKLVESFPRVDIVMPPQPTE